MEGVSLCPENKPHLCNADADHTLVAYPVPQPKFQHVIDTRPELTVDPLEVDERGGPCDVCTMGRARHASSLLTLFVRPLVCQTRHDSVHRAHIGFDAATQGPKYNRKTLQDLVSAEDSSAEEESDSEDENAGRKSRDKYYTFHSESCQRWMHAGLSH